MGATRNHRTRRGCRLHRHWLLVLLLLSPRLRVVLHPLALRLHLLLLVYRLNFPAGRILPLASLSELRPQFGFGLRVGEVVIAPGIRRGHRCAALCLPLSSAATGLAVCSMNIPRGQLPVKKITVTQGTTTV